MATDRDLDRLLWAIGEAHRLRKLHDVPPAVHAERARPSLQRVEDFALDWQLAAPRPAPPSTRR